MMAALSAQGRVGLRDHENETAVAGFWEPTEGTPYFVTPEYSLPSKVWVP